jgi:hypothetical protein
VRRADRRHHRAGAAQAVLEVVQPADRSGAVGQVGAVRRQRDHVQDAAAGDARGDRVGQPTVVGVGAGGDGGQQDERAAAAGQCRGQRGGVGEVGDGDLGGTGVPPRLALGRVADDGPDLLAGGEQGAGGGAADVSGDPGDGVHGPLLPLGIRCWIRSLQ